MIGVSPGRFGLTLHGGDHAGLHHGARAIGLTAVLLAGPGNLPADPMWVNVSARQFRHP